jgi:hypothetical protein
VWKLKRGISEKWRIFFAGVWLSEITLRVIVSFEVDKVQVEASRLVVATQTDVESVKSWRDVPIEFPESLLEYSIQR